MEHPPGHLPGGRARSVPAASQRSADRVGLLYSGTEDKAASPRKRTGPFSLPPLLAALFPTAAGVALVPPRQVHGRADPPRGHPCPAPPPRTRRPRPPRPRGTQAPAAGSARRARGPRCKRRYLGVAGSARGWGRWCGPRAAPGGDTPEGAGTQSPERPPRARPRAPAPGARLSGDSALEVRIGQGCARPRARDFWLSHLVSPAVGRSGWTRPASLVRFQSAGRSRRPCPRHRLRRTRWDPPKPRSLG